MRYRWTTFPTGARKGEWRETPEQAAEDAVAADMAEHEEDGSISLDLAVAIEDEHGERLGVNGEPE